MPSASPSLVRGLFAAAAAAVLASSPVLAQAPEAAGQVLAQGKGFVFSAAATGPGAYALREEVSEPALAQALGGRSASAALTVDCGRRQSAVSAVQVYAEPGLAGAATSVKSTAWLRASPVDLFDLTQALCAEPGAAAPPAQTAAPPDMPAETAAPAAPQAVEAPSAVPGAASEAGGRWVQLGAFGSAALAEGQWARTDSAALKAPGHRVEPVQRGSATLYRLLAGPFPSVAAAKAACASAGKAGSACLVR